MDNSSFRYEITDRIAVLADNGSGTTKELNRVSYNGSTPKYDLRSWYRSSEGEKLLKGLTLTDDEARSLKAALNNIAAL